MIYDKIKLTSAAAMLAEWKGFDIFSHMNFFKFIAQVDALIKIVINTIIV